MVGKNNNDNEIIRRVLDGKVNDYELLLNRYQSIVLKILMKRLPYEQVEEVAQIVFIKAYESLHTFSGEKPFKNWISSIALKTCFDFWRKQYKKKEISIEFMSDGDRSFLNNAILEQSADALKKKGQEKEAKELLDWALKKLSPEDRIVLELIYLEGYSNKETANFLGWSNVNVKVRSMRARRKLEKILRNLYLK
ncbi:MAG: RNA polymerase sigma factor [Methylophilaceae bacterium]